MRPKQILRRNIPHESLIAEYKSGKYKPDPKEVEVLAKALHYGANPKEQTPWEIMIELSPSYKFLQLKYALRALRWIHNRESAKDLL